MLSGRLWRRRAAALLCGGALVLALGLASRDADPPPREPSASPTRAAPPSTCPPLPTSAQPAQGPPRRAAPVASPPPSASTFTAARTADFSDGFAAWDLCGPSTLPEDAASVVLEQGGYDDDVAARATVPAGGGNKYARTVWGGTAGDDGVLDLGAGDELTYGMALLLPEGFTESVQDYFVPMRWDNFGREQVSRSGLGMYEDGSIRLFRERSGVEEQVNLLSETTFRLTEGVWHWLEVHQVLSERDGEALNELYVDGALVGRSTLANYYGEPVTALRFGIVAIGADEQTLPLSLLYDRAVLGRGYLGPRQP